MTDQIPSNRRGLRDVPRARPSVRTPLLRALVRRLVPRVATGRLEIVDHDGRTWAGGEQAPSLHGALHVRNVEAWRRVARRGNLGLGEGYVAGDWDSPDLVALLEVLAVNTRDATRSTGWTGRLLRVRERLPHLHLRNDRRRSRQQIGYHYDLGNDFYEQFLDPSMTYSCGVFESPGCTLEEAQVHKYRRVCERLDLRPGLRVLEIGCGWGGFAVHAAREHGVHVTGVTISEEQARYARARVEREGLGDLVDIRLVDYRDVEGTFDRVASIEMFEALGVREQRTFFKAVEQRLAPNGRACLQVIAFTERDYERIVRSDGWLRRYIFPGGACPSLGSFVRAMHAASDLQVLSADEIGAEGYPPTLAAWRERLHANAEKITQLGYDHAFLRGWELYLAWCEAAFRAGIARTMQIVLVPSLVGAARPVGASDSSDGFARGSHAEVRRA